MNVLIYYSSENSRRTIENYLDKLGASVNIISANNIALAKCRLSTSSFDLIIINVDNLNEKFMEVFLHAKANSPQASIIFLTLTNAKMIEENILRNGIDYYLNGFYRFEEFIDTIQNVAKQYLYESYSYNGFSKAN